MLVPKGGLYKFHCVDNATLLPVLTDSRQLGTTLYAILQQQHTIFNQFERLLTNSSELLKNELTILSSFSNLQTGLQYVIMASLNMPLLCMMHVYVPG